MSRPPRPACIPSRAGVHASALALVPGPWPLLLDALAERLPALPRADWAERMAAGDVLAEDGTPLPPDAPHDYRPGRRVFYFRSLPHEPALPEGEQIVYQDDAIVVADKPHFMPVTPGGRYVRQSLLVRLRERLGLDALSPVHRLDRETAGLVLFTARADVRDAYQRLFRERRVDKVYEAVAPHRADLALPRTHASRIEDDPDRFFLSREAPGAPNSETHIERVRVDAARALYRLRPVTGRRHQLRLHMLALGVPIEGDAFYPTVRLGPGELDDFSQPLQLLARALAFVDPITGERRQFESRLRLALAPV